MPSKRKKKTNRNIRIPVQRSDTSKDAAGVYWRVAPPDLNLAPELHVKDEAFWKSQEGRMTEQIGQPCCTLSGMTHSLIEIPGNFAVVLHSELDCTNCFLSTRGPSGVNFYSVAVTQSQFASGRMGPPLQRCLELIIKHKKPDAIFVLGNCLTEMVYDTYDMVSLEVSARLGTPIIPLKTSGLKHGSQAAMIDWLYSTLAGLAKKKQAPGQNGVSSRLNFLGMPHMNNEAVHRELRGYLEGAGISINGVYPYETSFDDWMKISRASANIVVDCSLYPQLLKELTNMGLPSVEVPLPVGLNSTMQFLDAIGQRCGVQDAMRRAYAPAAEQVRRRLGEFRKRWGGLRVAVGLRMVNNYKPDQLAYDGLGDVSTFLETGFKIHLMIQGPGDEKSRKHFADRLSKLGCTMPFDVFPDPFDLLPLLEAYRPDVAYLADHARWETSKVGVPLIQSRSLEPFFGGALRNIDYFEKVLTEIDRSRIGGNGHGKN